MAASTSIAYNTYPYPSTLNVANFVTIKLSDSSNYRLWKAQMLCLLQSQELFGYVDGTIQPPNEHGNGAIANQDYFKWKKSDQLVKGWIFGSLAKEILQNVAEKVSARHVWLELEDICCLKFPDEPEEGMRAQPTIDERVESNKDYKYYMPLYEALLCGNSNKAETFLMKDDEESRAPNTSSLQTALYVAIAERNDIEDSVPSENNDKYSFIEKLVDLMADDDGLAIRNWLGETPLHCAARFGNLRAANVLVNKNPNLPHLACYNGLYPIHLAVEYGYKSKDLVPYFFNVTNDPAPYTGRAGFRLLYRLICSELFDLATKLIERFPDLAKYSNESSPLSLLATRPLAFYGPLDKYDTIRLLSAEPSGSTAVYWNIFRPIISMQAKNFGCEKPVKLAECLCGKLENLSEEEIKSIVSGPLLEAVRVDNYKLVRIILQRFPSSVNYCNKKNGQNILHIATENHSTCVFRMLNRMSRHHRHYLMNSVDSSNNTVLHLAGKLKELDQCQAFGAALQMQEELLWFEVVKKLVPPSYYERLNGEGKTARQVFTEQHANLKIEGEKWLKNTAKSYVILVGLIVTISYAAAITVPGGINNNSGYPMFSENRYFQTFTMLITVSLCASCLSLFAFVSILTSRYAEKDFLHSLPGRLYCGCCAMLLSIYSMLTSFAFALYFLHKGNKILYGGGVTLAFSVQVAFLHWQGKLLLKAGKQAGRGLGQAADSLRLDIEKILVEWRIMRISI